MDHPKRRRRRLKPTPISATLTLTQKAKGDVGAIPQGLFTDLFGYLEGHETGEEVQYVAVTPWRPPLPDFEEDCPWTILPVRLDRQASAHCTIAFPDSPSALQSFATALQGWKVDVKSKGGIEILVLDAQPLELETVFVKVDGDALRRHEEVQRKFGGGFQSAQGKGYPVKGKGKGKARVPDNTTKVAVNGSSGINPELEASLKDAVRETLGKCTIVHCNDHLPLPLPTHPITHVPFPPLQVILCDPVDQGVMTGDTTIVIDFSSRRRGAVPRSDSQLRTERLRHRTEDDDDATAAQSFSAIETDQESYGRDNCHDLLNEASTTGSSESEEDSLSDESADNMISLNSPSLPMQTSSILSARSAAVPRPPGNRTSGIGTPGSAYSNYTATTARQGVFRGRPFRLKALVAKVPDSVLQPKPLPSEDDEARIFVDVKLLVRIGCFSGDWVKLINLPNSDESVGGLLPPGAFGEGDQEETLRVVKIYGLQDIEGSHGPRYPKSGRARRTSVSSVLPTSRPTSYAYVSPILLANLGQPETVAISPVSLKLPNDRKFSRSRLANAAPPFAKEVTLLRVPTPPSEERAVQAGLFANLKHHFENRRRIMREGDLVAISMDIEISRILSDPGGGGELDDDLEQLLLGSDSDHWHDHEKLSVAWFKVDRIAGSVFEEEEPTVDPEIWGGASSVEAPRTRMAQIGREPSRIPPAVAVPWEYYLGSRWRPKAFSPLQSPIVTQDTLPKPFLSPIRQQIQQLLNATTSPRAVRMGMDPVVMLLHSTQRSIGKSHAVSAACVDLGLHVSPIDSYDILTEGAGGGDVKSEGSLRAKIERALTCGAMYTVPLIQHVETLTADRMASAVADMLKDVRVLAFTTTKVDKIPENMRSLFTHEFELSAPDEKEREVLLRSMVADRGVRLAFDVDLAAVAVKTAALVAGDLEDVIERAIVARQERLESICERKGDTLIRDVLVSGGVEARCIIKADFDIAVDAARRNFADSIGAPKIPNVSWDDVGGLTSVKDAVMETIQLPLERPELFAKGMKKRSGILFYGPPGTGKTLLAKAIATEFSLNFFSVKGPELLNMYIGESEANVRRVFQRARDARPCVVFFDELDSVAPKRGNQGDSGGVMDRIVSQLLAELDGMSDSEGGSGGVFVIGATNRPDLLDQALLRPGRFDKMLYLGVSDTHEKQCTILKALTRKFNLHPDLSLRRVSENLPFSYTGADLYALCSDAMLKAITRKASAVDEKIKALPDGPVTPAYFFDHYATQEDIAVTVTEDDFEAARRELVASVRYVIFLAFQSILVDGN